MYALDKEGVISWDDLSKVISNTEPLKDAAGKPQQFTDWVQALESMMVEARLVTADELAEMARVVHAEKLHHDHDHDHDH